ncbi:hypothetical protein ACHAQH_007441 [Verticillium albo-atrum]
MALAPIPEESHRTVFEHVDQLTPDDQTSCDDLIVLLGKFNLRPMIADNETRAQLWEHVFADDWTSDCQSDKPQPFDTLTFERPSIEAGVLNGDHPAAWLPHYRITCGKGATVRLKPCPKWDEEDDGYGIDFKWFDKMDNPVPSALVNPKEGWTTLSARTAVVQAWDEAELERVGAYNLEVVTYWARNRLIVLAESRSHSAAEHSARDGPRPEVTRLASLPNSVGADMDLSEIRQIMLCADLLQELACISGQCLAAWGPEKPRGGGLEY